MIEDLHFVLNAFLLCRSFLGGCFLGPSVVCVLFISLVDGSSFYLADSTSDLSSQLRLSSASAPRNSRRR